MHFNPQIIMYNVLYTPTAKFEIPMAHDTGSFFTYVSMCLR